MDLEHVQPVQSVGADRRSRSRSRVAVAVPIALLVGVVVIGALGRVTPSPERPRVAVAVTPRPGVTDPPAPSLPPAQPAVGPAFPTRTIGLEVQTVPDLLEGLARGDVGTEVVAVAGWLSVPAARECAGSRDVVPAGGWELLCQRQTWLSADSSPLFSVEQGGIVPFHSPNHLLLPRAMPGVDLATLAQQQFQGYEGPLRPRRVVLAGRFGDPRLPECTSGSDACAETFAIERVIWADGEPQLRRAHRYPGLDDVELSRLVRWPILNAATERGAIVLSEMLLPRAELARFDPVADQAVPAKVDGPVWYIRTLLRSPLYGNATGKVGWAVIEDATAMVLASDPDGRSASAE